MQQTLPTLLCAVALSMSFAVACTQAPQNPKIPERVQTPSLKPDSESSAKVSLTALGELSRIERAIKPFTGVALSAPLETANSTNCRQTSTTSAAMWETRWICGLESTLPGRKEIEGVERVNFARDSHTLTYIASFETRTFNDREPRTEAHTLITERTMRIVFDSTSPGGTGVAKISMQSHATMKGTNAPKGSEWTSSMNGVLKRAVSDWSLDPGATIEFNGALYGKDGERKNIYASGLFDFVSDSNIKLINLGMANSCTKPDGLWKIHASGAGENLDTAVGTSTQGGQIYAGTAFVWPTDLCDQP